jgi:iron uptake system EfeUOB component EfeO/EfeM
VTDIDFDSDTLDACATGLDDVADRLVKAIEALEATVGNLGSAWGTGPVGSTIGELYTDVHNLALGCYESHAEAVVDFVAALDGAVELMDAAEHAVEADVKKLAAEVSELFSSRQPPQ